MSWDRQDQLLISGESAYCYPLSHSKVSGTVKIKKGALVQSTELEDGRIQWCNQTKLCMEGCLGRGAFVENILRTANDIICKSESTESLEVTTVLENVQSSNHRLCYPVDGYH